jgi:hypothetical protein
MLKFFVLLALVLGSASAAAGEEAKASKFSLEIDRVRYEMVNGLNKYHHARRYVERGGVGVTLTKGKICYIEQKKCLSALVKYRINAGGMLTQPRHLVSTTLDNETVTVEYWGKDDAGNKIAVKRVFHLSGEDIRIE